MLFRSLVVKVAGGRAAEVVEETRAWLRDHPDDGHVRATLLGVVRKVPDGPVVEVVEETRAWLRDHPDNSHIREILRGVDLHDDPTDETAQDLQH